MDVLNIFNDYIVDFDNIKSLEKSINFKLLPKDEKIYEYYHWYFYCL